MTIPEEDVPNWVTKRYFSYEETLVRWGRTPCHRADPAHRVVAVSSSGHNSSIMNPLATFSWGSVRLDMYRDAQFVWNDSRPSVEIHYHDGGSGMAHFGDQEEAAKAIEDLSKAWWGYCEEYNKGTLRDDQFVG